MQQYRCQLVRLTGLLTVLEPLQQHSQQAASRTVHTCARSNKSDYFPPSIRSQMFADGQLIHCSCRTIAISRYDLFQCRPRNHTFSATFKQPSSVQKQQASLSRHCRELWRLKLFLQQCIVVILYNVRHYCMTII